MLDNEKYSLALAKANLWLECNIDADTRREIVRLMNNPEDLIDAFYENLEFGTGGLRGIMGAGTNRMNVYVVEMATQGLCNYLLKAFPDKPKRVAIAYDSRNNSKAYAMLLPMCLLQMISRYLCLTIFDQHPSCRMQFVN